jgi:putative ABC transport system permease protein
VSPTAARRAYRALLRLGPRALRERHGEEMEALFMERWSQSRGASVSVWASAILDLARARLRDQRRAARRVWEPRTKARRTDMIGHDLRYALRSLLRQRLAGALVVAMLALGLAANVAVFGLINGLFLRPLPFPEPERLVYINERAPRWNLDVVGINYPDLDQWRREQRQFEAIAYYEGASFNASDGTNALRLEGAQVTHDFAAVLGVKPILGRFFTAEEDRPKGPQVVVISYGLWQDRFGGERDVLGKALRLDGVARTVIGVMPRGVDFPGGVRCYVPLAAELRNDGQSYSGNAIGRLKPGVTAAQGEADLLRTQQPIWDARDKEKVVSPYAVPLREELVRDFRTSARALAGAVGLLLVVACANVASLMLARALARRREIAIRVAVGASGGRLLVQLLVENLLFALAGGALGLALGYAALRALVRAIPDEVPSWAVFGLDARVVGFAFAATALTLVLFGWAPALHALRGDLRQAMSNAASATTSSPRGRRTLRLLVGAEFALAALLLVCGGLLLQAYTRVRQIDPGFEPRGVLTFGVYLPAASYPDDAKRLAFWNRLIEGLQAQPGVNSAAAITCAPLGCHWGNFFAVEGAPARGKDDKNPVVLHRYATVDYFKTMGIRLRDGRLFEPADFGPGEPRGAIVNEAFVREFLPGEAHPVGRRFRRASSSETPWIPILGVVGDVKHYGLERPMRPGLYFPITVQPADSLTVALKTAGDPASLVAGARAAVRELDPDLAVFQVRTMEQALRRSMTARATYSWLLAVFALLALLLALGGTYGVTGYLASQRTREMGIRIALGARTADIRRSVLKGSLAVVVVGMVTGALLSIAAANQISSLLFGVSPHDPVVLVGAVLVLGLTALAASWFPAVRASRVDPMTTLRSE